MRQAELLGVASKSFLREVLGSPEDYLSDNGATLVFNTVLEKCLGKCQELETSNPAEDVATCWGDAMKK